MDTRITDNRKIFIGATLAFLLAANALVGWLTLVEHWPTIIFFSVLSINAICWIRILSNLGRARAEEHFYEQLAILFDRLRTDLSEHVHKGELDTFMAAVQNAESRIRSV